MSKTAAQWNATPKFPTSHFVDSRIYSTLDPLSANKLTGTWTPPLTKDDILMSVSRNQGVATTAFLHSLVQTGQSGVDPADLRLAVLQPDDDPALVEKAVQRLIDRCWFFDYDGLRYRFKTEPSLRKIVDDEMGLVGKIKATGTE